MAKKSDKGVAFFENSSWYHRTKELQDDGSVKYSKKGGFASAKEAEKSYWQYEEAFKKNFRILQMQDAVNTDIMFKDYLIYWFEEVFSKRIESTTRMVGAYAIYDLILPQIEYDVKLRYLNVEYLDELLERASKCCASAGNKSREILNLALKEAVIGGYIKNNPVPGTKPYPREKPKIIILNKNKIKLLLTAASKGNWYLEILLALFCGLRKGEILGLKFTDFDLEKSTVTINRQVAINPVISKGNESYVESYERVEKDPKTPNSFRTLRVPEVIIEELGKRKRFTETNKERLGEDYLDKGYISCQSNGLIHSMSAMNIALTKLCSRHGLPGITVHGLRHMYATILIEKGVSLIKISALLGHSSVHTTFEYYCDVMDEDENILTFMNKVFEPIGA